MSFKDFLKKLEWQDKALIVSIVILCLIQFSLLSKFVQVPGPFYGGDLYYHYGHAVDIREGGSIFASSHFLGEYEHYPWLFHVLVAFMSLLFGITVLKAFIFFPIIITILAGVIFYFLVLKLTGSKTISLVSALLWMVMSIPSSHPTTFSAKVIIPFFALMLFSADTRNKKILAGIAYGLAGLAHVTAFLGASLIILFYFIYKVIEKEKAGKINYAERIKNQVIFFLPIAVIGILIAMLYWWAPIFVYHGQTPNNWQEYGSIGVANLNISWILKSFGNVFFNTSGVLPFVISIISLLGVYIALTHLRKFNFMIILLVASLAGIIHPWLTMPLFGTSFGFYRFPEIVLLPAAALFFGIGALIIFNSFRNENTKKLVLAVLIGLVVVNFYSVYAKYDNDQWTKVGRSITPDTGLMFAASDFFIQNTGVNDVILASNGESEFAINALTGRKVVYMRSTHASPYADVNKRVADSAIILYGDNETLRKQLLEEYHATYFFFEPFSAQAAGTCVQAWDSFENPQAEGYTYYCMKTSPEYKSYLEANGVETKIVNARLDPANANAPKLDLLLIKPKQFAMNFTIIDSKGINNQTAYIIAKINS